MGFLALDEQARRAALDVKRDAAIEKKNEAAPVKMNWAMKAPIFYQRELAAVRSTRTVLTVEEAAAREQLEERRAFRMAARHIFRLADVDGSRALEYRELERLDSENASELLELMDGSGDGEVSMEEWLSFTTKVYESRGVVVGFQMLQLAERVLFERTAIDIADKLFKLFDRDGSGSLDYGEVSAMFPQPRAADAARGRRQPVNADTDQAFAFMQYVDLDRSGTLELDEWRDFILQGWRRNPMAAHAFLRHLRDTAKAQFGA